MDIKLAAIRTVLIVSVWVCTCSQLVAQITPALVRARTEREWNVKAEKMSQHLLPAMRTHDIDLWIILSRENAPDPLLELFGGYGITGWYGQRNAYLFYAPEDGELETTAIGTHLSDHLARFFSTRFIYGEEGLAPHLERYTNTFLLMVSGFTYIPYPRCV